MTRIAQFAVGMAMIALAGCTTGPAKPDASKPAPLFNDLGSHAHKVTTTSEQAQRYFNQGVTLAFGFNHAEAERSFREAARLDPDCAMCWWGVAYVLGPNINVPMDAAAAAPAVEAVQKAQAASAQATPAEKAYIDAIAKRYANPAPADRAPLDKAYADAMREVVRQNPDDLDAAAAFAESLMDLNPWDYYDKAGKPMRPETKEIVATLESVLKRDPKHAWAIHLYIHATEASDKPGRAAPYADTLATLVPGAGHLVHMPGHTYMRIGRYHDAMLANERATAADDSYIAQCAAQGVYAVGYVPHNHHFLAAAASMAGNSAAALKSALGTDAHTVHEMEGDPNFGTMLQHFALQPLLAMVRFGKWDQILALPEPASGLDYRKGIWHYARGRAYAANSRLDLAHSELAALTEVATRPQLKRGLIYFNSAADVLAIAVEQLAGEIDAQAGRLADAIAHLQKAVEREDALRYNEPPDWLYPVRHSLGAVLLAAGQPEKAEAVYREDLKQNPENGWSLYGLAESLAAQGKKDEFERTKKRFDKAWEHADIKLTASKI